MRKKVFHCILIVLIIAQCAFIYFQSAQDAESSAGMSAYFARIIARALTPGFSQLSEAEQDALTVDYQSVTRKLAHLAEFACLGALMALLLTGKGRWGILGAIVFSACAASLDEAHQLVSPGRSAEFSDILLDACGALLGIAFVSLLFRLFRRMKRRAAE